jgi:hypothetical protein
MSHAREYRQWFVALTICASFSAGCGPDPIPIDQLAGKVTAALCARAVACGRFLDSATCLATMTVDYSRLDADSQAKRIFYDAQSAGECVEAITNGQGPGSCSVTDALSAADLPSCRDAVVGQVGRGEPCYANDECGTRLCDFSGCSANDACCTGTCRQVVGVMGDCAAPGAVCDDGLACVKDSSLGMLCQAQVGSGGSCVGSSDCHAYLLCLFDPATRTGTCGRLPTTNQTCAPVGGPRCDAFADYCDPTTNKCTRRVGSGDPCPKHVECPSFERCDVAQDKCVSKGAAGAACAADDECLEPLACTKGSCAPGTSRICAVPGM